MVKLNPATKYEALPVRLSKEKTPIAFENKIQELLEQGAFKTREEAEYWLSESDIELELYYEKNSGLFAVESEAVENGEIYSPYTGEECEPADEE